LIGEPNFKFETIKGTIDESDYNILPKLSIVNIKNFTIEPPEAL